jgi:hypothetical protein
MGRVGTAISRQRGYYTVAELQRVNRWKLPTKRNRRWLANKVHISVRPHRHEELRWVFEAVLQCGPVATIEQPSKAEPILAVRLSGGGNWHRVRRRFHQVITTSSRIG